MMHLKNISIYCFVLALFIPLSLSAQSNTVVGSIGKDKITYGELKENFISGNNSEFSVDEIEEFLPLYIDYQTKLKFARENNYYTDSTLIAEHQLYLKQAAYAYWLDKEIRPAVFDEYYKRASKEMKSFHILVATSETPTEEEKNAAIEKLNQAKKEIENGVSLEVVNKKYSTARNGRSMGGDLPWLSAGRTVKEFEDQLFSLEIGEISEPFATQFGYHIVLLQDVRERTPAKSINHIYVRTTPDSSAYKKITEAYTYLESGKSWANVMQQYSEDQASKSNNGNIGWVSYHSNYATDFLDAIADLKPEDSYSEPVKTQYGYHIFQVDSVQTYESEEAKKKELMKELEKSNHYKENNAFITEYLSEKFGSEIRMKAINKYGNYISGYDSASYGTITLDESLSSVPVYEFNGNTFTLDDFHTYLSQSRENEPVNSFTTRLADDFVQFVVDNEVVSLTLEKFPEFENQSESYLNGLVVYQLNDDYLWSAATVDTTKLEEIYHKNAQKYRYESRPHFYMLTSSSDSVLQEGINFIQKGNSPDSIRSHYKRIFVSSDSMSVYDEEPYNRLSDMKNGTFSEIFDHKKRKTVFYLVDTLPARKMTFDEAFNRLLSEYQPERERIWMKELRKKYKVKTYPKKLRKAFKKDSSI